MQFGLYGTNSHVTVGSSEIAQAILESHGPLPASRQDMQFEFGLEMMLLFAHDAAAKFVGSFGLA